MIREGIIYLRNALEFYMYNISYMLCLGKFGDKKTKDQVFPVKKVLVIMKRLDLYLQVSVYSFPSIYMIKIYYHLMM